MKKVKIFVAAFLFALIAVLVLFASGDSVYAASDEAPADYIWKITHKNGDVEYSNSFSGAFSDRTFKAGDVFLLKPGTYSLTPDDFIEIQSSVDITIDVSGSKIFCAEEADVPTQMFLLNIGGTATVTFLADGSEIYASKAGRTIFTVNGTGYIGIDGGEAGAKLFAPGVLNIMTSPSDNSRYSYLKNVYCCKYSGNMAGLVSVRKTGYLKIIDSVIVSQNSGYHTIYLCNSGSLSLESSYLINMGGGTVLNLDDGNTSTFEVGGGCYVYGSVKNPNTEGFSMKLWPNSYYSSDFSAYIKNGTKIESTSQELSLQLYECAQPGSFTEKAFPLKLSYGIKEEMKTTLIKDEKSVWQMDFFDGTTEYTDSIYAPFGKAYEYKSLTLLKDIVVERSVAANMKGDFSLDLNGKNIIVSEAYKGTYDTFIVVSGTGALKLSMGGSTVVLGNMGFISAKGISSVEISGSGAYLDAAYAVKAEDAAVTVNGGFYDTSTGYAFTCGKDVMLSAATVKSKGVGEAISSKGNVSLYEGCVILSSTGACAVSAGGTLAISDGTYIYGIISANELQAEGYAAFAYSPKCKSSNKLFIKENVKVSFDMKFYTGKEMSSEPKTYSFTYITADVDDDVFVNFSLSESVALNIYIPSNVIKYSDSFTLRIAVDGLLYESFGKDAEEIAHNGKRYTKLTYDYIYPSSYSSDVVITLMASEQSVTKSVKVSELIERSFAASEDSAVKAAIATYAAYSARVSGYVIPPESEMNNYIRTYTAKAASSELGKYFSGVAFYPHERKFAFEFKEDITGKIWISYTFGKDTLEYSASVDSRSMSIPVYRLSATDPIIITRSDELGDTTLKVSLFDIIDFAIANGRSTQYFELYGAYVSLFAE